MTKAAASGGTGEELNAVATAPAVTTSVSTVRGQRRRKAAGTTATATITTAAQPGIPRTNGAAFNSYTSAISTVNAQSIAIQCTGRSRLGGGASGSMPRQYPRRSRFRVVPQADADCCT